LAGEFHKGWEKDYVVIRLDLPGQTRNVVYHEYVHKLLHLNFTRLPVWLDEGLAEFFASTESRSKEMFLGAPSPRIQILRARSLYPLPTILLATQSSPYYRDEDKIGMFYAESWGLTHFLMFGENMGRGQRMNAYLESLQKGVATETAFEQAFGDPKAVQKQFEKYVGQFTFLAMRIDKPDVDVSAFKSGPLSAAETDARLGGFFTYFHQLDLANQRLTAALRDDPESALAHENTAFLKFQQGNDEEAAKEFDEAVKLDPTSYLSLYYQAMLKFRGKTDADSLSSLDAALQKVLRLNPRFASALVVRSQIYVRQGKLQDALDLAMQAQKLEPDRAGYLTNAAAILLLGRNYPESIKLASTVAGRWAATDSAEALTIVARARQSSGIQATSAELAQETEEMKYAEDTIAAEGVIESVSCEKSKPMQIVLESGEKSLHFRAGKTYGMGFTDTLWYGEDHFNPCHHLEGMKAVVRYKASSDQNEENEFRWLEIRDELTPNSGVAISNR
jgi:tetratricopeptide (TPR) repeat protein